MKWKVNRMNELEVLAFAEKMEENQQLPMWKVKRLVLADQEIKDAIKVCIMIIFDRVDWNTLEKAFATQAHKKNWLSYLASENGYLASDMQEAIDWLSGEGYVWDMGLRIVMPGGTP